MSKDLELSMRIQALVKGLDDVRRLHSEINSLSKDAKEINNAQSAAFRLGQSVRGLVSASAVGGGIAAATFTALARSVIDADEQLSALSGRTGIAADKLAELKYAAEQSNTSIEVVARGVAQFNRVLLEAQKGGAAGKYFQALGLDPKSLGDADSALGKVMDRLRGLDEDTASAFAQKFYGRGGDQMLEFLRLGSEGLERLRKEARETGVATVESAKAADAFKDAIGKLTTVVQGLVREAISPALPVFSQFIQRVIDGKRELGDFNKSLDFVFRESLGGNLDNLPKAIDASIDRIDALKKKLEEAKKPTFGNVTKELVYGAMPGAGEVFVGENTVRGISLSIQQEEKRLAALRGLLTRERARADADARPPAAGAGVDLSVFDKDRPSTARDFSSQRFQVARAEAEGELKILQDTLQRYGREWDFALEKNLVSFRSAAQARINIAQAEIDAQLRARQAELDAAERIATDPKADEGKRIDALAKIKTLQADITVLRQQRGDVEVSEGRKAADQEEQLAIKLREVHAELAAIMQQGGSGAAVRAQLEETFKLLLQSPSVSDEDRGALRRLIDAKGAQADLRDFQTEYTRVLDELSVAQDRITIQQRAGTLTETQARQELVELYRQTGDEIGALIPKLEALAKTSNLPELEIALGRAKNKVIEMRAATEDLEVQIRGQLGDAVGDFLTDFETGAKSLGDALTDAMKRFERAVLDIINRRLGMALVDSIFGPMNQGGGGGAVDGRELFANWGTTGGTSWHTGGLVGGPMRTVRRMSPIAFAGAPRLHRGLAADEFPAILQRGERVLSRAEVAAGAGGAPIINVINPPQQPQVTPRRNGNAWEIDIVFRQAESYMMERAMRGQGLGQVFNQRFGMATR